MLPNEDDANVGTLKQLYSMQESSQTNKTKKTMSYCVHQQHIVVVLLRGVREDRETELNDNFKTLTWEVLIKALMLHCL